MEGGVWGLVIVAAAFMIQVFAFGNTFSIGVYNIELLEYFGGATVAVSLIGSINFGVFLGCGPVVSFLMTRFSYRKIALFGSLLVVIGLLGMPVFPYIPTMCFFFGVLTGFGSTCVYVTSHVLSGLYYDKYRSLATGIATSGSGLGNGIMPIIVSCLIEEYSWKGSLIFLAGLSLHLFVFSALLRDPPCLETTEVSVDKNGMHTADGQSQSLLGLEKKGHVDTEDHVPRNGHCAPGSSPGQFSQLDHDTTHDTEAAAETKPCTVLVDSHNIGHDGSSHSIQNTHAIAQNSHLSKLHSTSVTSVLSLGGGAKCPLPVQTAQDKKPKSSRHIYIFTHYEFDVYFISNLMWNISASILSNFSPEFFRTRGSTDMEAAMLFGVSGIGVFVGGILGGVLGNIHCFNRTVLYVIFNLLLGLFLLTLPFGDGKIYFACNMAFTGLSFGSILGLLIVVLTDLIGIESLGNGMGYLMLANGFGCFVGPPLAGLLKEATGTYDTGMYLAGVVSLFGGAIMLLIPIKNHLKQLCK